MKATFKKAFLGDIFFFIAVIAVPSSFFSFINRAVFFDLRLVYMLIGGSYLLCYFKHMPKITRLKGGWILLVVCGYTGFKIIHSIYFQGISWIEVATIFRANYFYPIATLGFLLYASKMDNKRLFRFVSWLFTVTLIIGIVYIISSLTGINFYANEAHSEYQSEGTTVLRNFLALPDYNRFLYAFGLLVGLVAYKFNKHWLWLIPLIVTVISLSRGQIIVYFLNFLCLIVFSFYSRFKIEINKLITACIFLLLGLVVVQLVFPVYLAEVVDRFGLNDNSQVSIEDYTEQGTFGFRLTLIADSYLRTKSNGNLIFGNGYIREAPEGDYDFVLGFDTYIAPIIWTEGFLGLFVRLLPIFYFLIWAIKNIRSYDSERAFFSIVIISLILPEFVNIVQTKMYAHYHHYIFMIYLFILYQYNRKYKYDKFSVPLLRYK